MVKQGSSTFSAASGTKGSVILSRAIKKNFALEAEVSRLRHHVSILSRRLHSVKIEQDGLRDMVTMTVEIKEWGEEPLVSEEVAEESDDGATPSVARMSEYDGHEVTGEKDDGAAPSVAGMSMDEGHEMAEEEDDGAAPSWLGCRKMIAMRWLWYG